MECNILDQNQTYDVHEFFDYNNNRDLVKQYSGSQEIEVHYDYNINEVIFILTQPNADPQCQATTLSAHPNVLMFGDRVVNGGNHIFSPSGAFHFNQDGVIEVYKNKDVVRGINVDKWYSCQYWSKMNATMNITWYFADANTWDTSIGLKQAPVRCHVTSDI
ncbi:uncharacterized protein LOC121366841, partial [Gigantopelta aegis]|uniref:uncharacterized protein LOC121366841 n=1 Tax=Gigantopelta aegis TaxID=1735272 RepID=UPI001B88D818